LSSKIRSRNTRYLNTISRDASNNVRDRVVDIINLYKEGKISQMQTAENILLKLLSGDGRTQKAGIQQYNKTIEKFKQQEPLKQRLEAKSTDRNIKREKAASILGKAVKSYNRRKSLLIQRTETQNIDKPLTTVKFHLNTKDAYPKMPNPEDKVEIEIDYNFENGRTASADTIFENIKNRLHLILLRKLTTLLESKKSMKASIGCYFKLYKFEVASNTGGKQIYSYKQEKKVAKTKALSINRSNLDESISDMIEKLDFNIINLKIEESGWPYPRSV